MKPVGVIAYDLAHNAAGRAYNLAQMYARFTDVEIVGPVFTKFGGKLWRPLRGYELPLRWFISDAEENFIKQAEQLVRANPYKLVHVSKPRLPSLIFAALYQRIWGSELIVDVDDEEMAFVNADQPLDLEDYMSHSSLPGIDRLHGKVWTQLCVGLVSSFARVTVSNPALQRRYGGTLIPHTRDESKFMASVGEKRASRQRFGIDSSHRVVLYSGTPRKHKGLLKTAEVVQDIADDNLRYVVVGEFPDATLRQRLIECAGPYLQLIPGQPFSELAQVSATADVVVLLQDTKSPVSNYQLPAKLIDALAAGAMVMLSFTESTRWLMGEPGIDAVTEETLEAALRAFLTLDHDSCVTISRANQRLFESHFSFAAVVPRLQALANNKEHDDSPLLSNKLNHLLQALS